MASDDFEVVAFKILSYLYRCMKNGKKVDIAALRQLTGCVFPTYAGMIPRHPFRTERNHVNSFLMELTFICRKVYQGVSIKEAPRRHSAHPSLSYRLPVIVRLPIGF